MKKRINHEKIFEKEVANAALLKKMRYYKIPDTHMVNKYNRNSHYEEKRPFDGVLVTRFGNALIECKYGNNKLLPHQEDNKQEIDKINQTFFVLTKKYTKTKGWHYIVQHINDKWIFNDIIKMVRHVEYLMFIKP